MRNLRALLSLLLFIPFMAFSQGVKPGFSKGHANDVVALDFSPNGKFVISAEGTGEGAVKLWEASTGRLLKTWNLFAGNSGYIEKYACDVAFVDDEYFLAAVIGRPLVMLKITDNEDSKGEPFLSSDNGLPSSVRAIRMHPKKKEVLVLDENGQMVEWNLKTMKPTVTFESSAERITSFSYSSNGSEVYTGTGSGKIYTWNAKKGTPISNVKSRDNNVLTLEADHTIKSNLFLTGTENKLELWDAQSDERTALPNVYSPGTGFVSPLRPAAFSPDGKLVAYGGIVQKPALFIWDVENKKLLYELIDSAKINNDRDEYIFSARFSADGKNILSGYGDGTILMWDAGSGKLMHRLEGKPKKIDKIGFTSDHKFSFVVHDFEKKITVWNGPNNVTYSLEGHDREVLTAAFTPDDRFLYSSGEDNSFIKWDYKKDSIVWEKNNLKNKIKMMAIDASGKFAVTSAGDKKVELWDLEKGTSTSLGQFAERVSSLAFSEDGRYALVAQNVDGVFLFDKNKNWKKTATITGQKNRFNNPVAFSEDGKYFLSVSLSYSLFEVWDIEQQVLKDTFGIKGIKVACGANRHPAFSPDDKEVLLPALGGAFIWNLETRERRFFSGGADDVTSVGFTAGGKVAVAGGSDGSMTLWRIMDGEEMVTIYQLGNNDWVAVTPNGLFDASPNAFNKMYFTNQLETIDLEQLKDIYHEPDLLPILMRYKSGIIRKEEVFDSLMMYPEVTLDFKKDSLLDISLEKRSGGIGKVSVYINGSEIIEDARDPKHPNKCDLINIWDYESHFYLNEEDIAKNVITVRAYNEGEWLKSPPIEIYPFGSASKGGTNNRTYKGKKRKAEAGLYAIVVGTHDYKEKPGEKSIDLRYSSVDAKTMVTALNNITEGFIKGPKEIVEITTADPDVNNWPTKSTIRKAFDDVIKKSKAEDVFVLFLSGHGKTYSDDKTSDFYYLTSLCSTMDLTPPEVRNDFCIPTDTLTHWISKIPAKKRVIIMDACESGAGAQKFSAAKSLTSSQKKELEMLKDRNGSFVLASSESGQQSYEDWNRKQGLLTYSLMDGLVKTDGRVSVLELFQHSIDVVPDLAKNIRAEQTPVLTIPSEKVESFTIGWVDDPSIIPMSGTRDLIAPCLFLDKNKMNDHLYLSNLIDEQLDEGEVPGKLGEMGRGNPQNENVYGIRGLYEMKNGTVYLEGRVFKNTTPQGDVFKVEFLENSSPQEKENKIINEVNKILDGVN